MPKYSAIAGVLLAGLLTMASQRLALAQVPPTENPDQLAMLASDDPQLARNKKLVFDFWRIVYEGGHLDQAPKYMAPTYVQHNPNVKSGRDAFVELFKKQRAPRPIAPRIKVPVISIVAERDRVIVSYVRKVRDRQHPDHIYFMTWFDAFRIENGLIAEHWDCSELWGPDGKPPGAEFFP